ncbi:tetratricopeptide (TPR) repeat protein [Pelomonas saccharophila]|uniref:Tetratricopeptide (TPR) repeat protein n=1 Tax=Roseateles saccharophilus TaxID=304 RepID=A0ABU1YLE3_ROSSA|nr:tetratricopeptide repeat protein [Roseateles saccharophilus]MDR7269679.1 tetratricopeptide (TPR) repeat protein [Roseateles saccharophilus]
MRARSFSATRLLQALAAIGLVALGGSADRAAAFDPLLDSVGGVCAPTVAGQPVLLQALLASAAVQPKTETAPFQPAPMKAAPGDVPVYKDLGRMSFKLAKASPKLQAYFDQGLRLSFAFNHAEAQRAFQAAQKLDPGCGLCFWGEALILGPNINVPMQAEANAPAWAALQRAVALKDKLPPRERLLIEALQKRYAAEPPTDRAPLDAAYADAMKAVAKQFPGEDLMQVLAAEAAMDTQPWDYWEAAGAKPKGRTADILALLEAVLKRNPNHAGAIHLYIHAVEASTTPDRALAPARRLAALMPGAGHIVHMPAHIYYRVGLYRESLEANRQAIAVDEAYFKTSPSDPLYRSAYYPHNIHFLMVSAQMGGAASTAIEAAGKLDASMPVDVVKAFPIMQPVKAAPYTTHAQFSSPDVILKLAAPSDDLVLVRVMYHYARAVAQAARHDAAAAKQEIAALTTLEAADFSAFDAWGIPAKAIAQTAHLVATARLADAQGDLAGAAAAFEQAVAIEEGLAYTEPAYWYYPVRQSLGAVRLRQGRLDEAEKALRDSLARVRNNGWALAALAEVYKKRGDAAAEKSARQALSKAWFGTEGGPDLTKL